MQATHANVVDSHTAQMNQFTSFLTALGNPSSTDVLKLMAAQEISEKFEVIIQSPLYSTFLEHAVKIFLKILQDGEPLFLADYNLQQVRKLILDMLYRLPTNDTLKPYVKTILSLMFRLLEIDNEVNVLVCLKIIIELHKQYRPVFNQEIQRFLHFVEKIYSDLPSHTSKIFEPRPPIVVADLSKLNIEEALKETFTTTVIQTEIKKMDNTFHAYYLIPKAVISLKVLQELPIIVVLMYQFHKEKIHQDVGDFIPLIMKTITLQPTPEQMQSDSFNKELFVDFMGAQIKTLSFLAYIIKPYKEVVQKHGEQLVQGMLGLLTLCPKEVANLRRELLIAGRHILATELRNQFVPHMEKLFDEDILLGKGWTTYESLRPLAYSTLTNVVDLVRQQLSFSDLTKAIHLFSKIVHDDGLATTIQTMACKLLLNLVDCVIKVTADADKAQEGRELLMKMLEVFVLKFKTIAKVQLPVLLVKCKQQNQQIQATIQAQITAQQNLNMDPKDSKSNPAELLENALAATQSGKEDKGRFGTGPVTTYNIADYRSLVKTLVCGVKTITWGCPSTKPATPTTLSMAKHFYPHETLLYIRLVKWALKALDVYTLQTGPQPVGIQRINQQNLRSKEEKEVLEHFSGVFSMMNSQTFHEVFSTTIEYLVERVYKNPILQTVPNTLLANPPTSPIFATILVEYLLERMEEMGNNLERSNLYLKLFKLVFGSVSLFPTENENMLRPHLHQIVNRSMELAMTAKEPYNYFLLLRALFRSIGGGSHDLLYQEFLPLLPNLLEGLNRLQSGLHKQHMKDLFVELCLTVPVRLSSLLPYLPMLMDPLVSALNGSPVLISQGLRTLELCVDNLQHDFLYEHIQPVRADLMQALWRTLRNNDHVAFKVLGKFGGGNRKMMVEPQKLNYVTFDIAPASVIVKFYDVYGTIIFPVQNVIETAFNALKQSNTEAFYRKQAWEVIHCYLAASINLTDDQNALINMFLHPSFQNPKNISTIKPAAYKSIYTQARLTHQTALTGMFVAAAVKELRERVLPVMMSIVRHYTMVAVAQQSGYYASSPKPNEQVSLDTLVLVDALTIIMGHEEKELCKPGHLAFVLMVDTAATLLGNKEMACKLPLIEYLAERMCSLCYERAWFAKLGGCIAIKFMFDACCLKWVFEHMLTFLKALLLVMMDLAGEVSSGALDMAKTNLEKMLMVCVTILPDNAEQDLKSLQKKALQSVTHELVRQVTSTFALVREQAMFSLKLLAEKQNITITAVMEPYKNVLADMIPPKKHLLKQQPAIAQMGLMDGNFFCTTLNPQLFKIDMSIKEHDIFIHDLISICNYDDAKLNSMSCYKSMTNFIPLKKCALRVLAACHYLEKVREQIFQVLYKALETPNLDLQQTAFESLKLFVAGYPVGRQSVRSTVRPLLMTLGDIKNLTYNGVKMLSYLTQLFPLDFNEKLCEQLLEIAKQLMDNLINNHSTQGLIKKNEEIMKIVIIIGIFHQIPAASCKFILPLCQLVLKAEKAIYIEASSPYREALMKFLLRYPAESLDLLLSDTYAKDKQHCRYVNFLIKHKDGKPFRDHLQNNMVNRLIAMLFSSIHAAFPMSEAEKNALQYQSIRIVSLLIKYDEQWLVSQQKLIKALKQIWCDDAYQESRKKLDALDYPLWQEPKLVVKILLRYFCHHTNEIDLLFQLLRIFCGKFISDFQFFRDFLESTVAQHYTVEWKRSAFFQFVELFPQNTLSQELKAKILQLILIPCFAVSFERGETNKIIGSSPMPYEDEADNIVSVFINKLIDPDSPHPTSDCVRISLLQFSCLLFEQASNHFHDPDPSSTTQGFKLRRLMTFAWPCFSEENCIDPATRYHGHLLLCHIIYKYKNIHKKIVLQVFHSLLKAHAVEARYVVRQAFEILTPSLPLKLEGGNSKLIYWTKKIIVDEGHSMQQLFHILQYVVKHHKVYYPVRNQLVQHMVNSIQRLGFSPTATLEHKKLAVELSEVIIKWKLYEIREDDNKEVVENIQMKRPMSDDSMEGQRKKFAMSQPSTSGLSSSIPVGTSDSSSPDRMDKTHTDAVLNFLLRLACQINDTAAQPQPNPIVTSPSEMLARRCIVLLKTALKPEVWPQPVSLKLLFLDKLLVSIEEEGPNIGNIATGLEMLTYFLCVMKRDHLLGELKILKNGLCACVHSTHTKIIKLMHGLISKMMAIFPPDRTSPNAASKHEELEKLYTTIYTVINDGLNSYEKSVQPNPPTLFGTIMLLKAACACNPYYIDILMTSFMRVLHRLAKEHLQPTTSEYTTMTSELLILCLDLVKGRVIMMGVEMRKTFIGNIFIDLIEKSPDLKVMKIIIKILDDWMRYKTIPMNQTPSLREKSILLVRLMQFIEKRFSDDSELIAQYLELILYVYTDAQMKITELTTKLEPAFLSGLRCTQPLLRAKFFKIFDDSMRRRLHDRLLYVVCSQNWEAIGSHYWIKQCLELILVTTAPGIQMTHQSSILPTITSVMYSSEAYKKREHIAHQDFRSYSTYAREKAQMGDAQMDMDGNDEEKHAQRAETISKMVKKHFEFVEICKSAKVDQFFTATAQLCHMDTNLAEQVWLNLFPRIWDLLTNNQKNALSREILLFITSGAHILQKDCQPSAINTFVEAVTRCQPPVQIPPPVMKYLGKSHNMWHRMSLNLEQTAFEVLANMKSTCYDFESDQTRHEVLDSLSDLYALLCEEDLWAGLWQKHAHFKETTMAITFEQHGYFEHAQSNYEAAMYKYKQENTFGAAPSNMQREILLWSEHWIRCAKELNMWDILYEYAKTGVYDPFLVMEAAWRLSKWDVVKETMVNVEYNCPKELAWKVTMFGGFVAVCPRENNKSARFIDRYVENATTLCLAEWRRLPTIVSHIHLPYLQAAQQIMELQESYQIHKGLLHGHQNSLHDMKAIVKTWRNRLPVIGDDLIHWNEIFTWRQHHYQMIISHFENIRDGNNANSMLGVHAYAQSIIHFGKVARKHKLTSVCLETLSKIYTITSVPLVDCYQKIRQVVKCYLQQSSSNTKNDLLDGLEVINNTNVQYFAKDMIAEFYALKGMIFHLNNKTEEANKAFSAAVQMHDGSAKSWGLYGDYLEQVFTRDHRQCNVGVNAIACFLHACRHQNESKARKYISKVLWLLSFDDENSSLMKALDKYSNGIMPLLWLPWTPQLLNCLIQYDGHTILNILGQVGRMFPQAVYFPIRILYLALRTATARKINIAHQHSHDSEAGTSSHEPGTSTAGASTMTNEASYIKATPAIVRCTTIMRMQRDIYPIVLLSLEGIADQMEWFREYWYEEVLRHLRQALAKCYAIAFENREYVLDAKFTDTEPILRFVKKLKSTFGTGLENISSAENVTFNSTASESLARRAEATHQDPVFQETKQEFVKDFDFSQSNSMRLHNLMFKLKKWIKILENRSRVLLQSFLMEDKCRFLSIFSLKTAEVELPGEFLLPKHNHYFVRITRFMPRVDVVQKHNASARRLYIRGHNGKIYPYLVLNDSGLADARREERVLQLLRMLNTCLGKQKETSRRFLNFTVPRVVAVSQQIRLVEDNPNSLSLLDIYKKECVRLGIEYDKPINYYYERLALVQSRSIKASHQVYREILKYIQTTMIPKTLLRQWAVQTFPSATDYWQFRKMFTLQLALACFAEYVFNLTRLNPEMMYLHQDSGLMNVSYFKFDVDDSSGDLDTTRPVPFRLTPNIVEFLSCVGISGPLTASMIATARCLSYPNYKVSSLLKPILRDEMITVLTRMKSLEESSYHNQDRMIDGEQVIGMVNKAINSISSRLNTFAHLDGTETRLATLVAVANSHDNLCRMDPAWHPWF